MKRHIFTLWAVMAAMLTAHAAGDNYSYTILHEVDTVIKAKVQGITLGSRDVHHIIYEYPSTDCDKKPVTISGVVMIPKDIAEGKTPCDGVVLYNRFTVDSLNEVASRGGLLAESILMSNPLKPNYIIVSSDYLGYGSSEDHQMAYLSGDTNARNSLDGLLAARQMLSDKQISQGKYLFNIGFSQGGTEAMYVAKLRDMEYKDKVTFTKTFAGGGVMDCELAYTEFVKQEKWDSFEDLAMLLISMNENHHMNIDYKDLFKEPLASSIPKVLKSKNKKDLALEGIDSLSKLLQPAYLTPNTEQFQTLKAKFAEIKITKGWTPDTTQCYYYTHCRHDNYIPIQSGRSIIKWLKEQGYKASLVPGKTKLQTNMLVFKVSHQLSGIFWAVQALAAVQYWPTIYYDGEQMRMYHDVVKDLNLMKVIKTLEGWGIDLRKMISSNAPAFEILQDDVEQGRVDGNANASKLFVGGTRRADFYSQLTSILNTLGLSFSDAIEMLDDSGITLADLLQVYVYLTTPAAGASAAPEYALDSLEKRVEAPLYLMRQYEQTLAAWFLLGGYDVEYAKWGW